MGKLTQFRGKRIYLDANIFIYTLEQFEPWSEIALEIWTGVDSAEYSAATSEMTLAECLTGPFRAERDDLVPIYSDFIPSRKGLNIFPVERGILIEAARLRAKVQSLRLPDAIHIATARLKDCDFILTNDRRMESAPGIAVVFLSELTSKP